MPSPDPRAAEIIKTVIEFEQSVAAAEDALISRDWAAVDALLSDQRRLTHALQNALEDSRNQRPAKFTAEVQRRLANISELRAGQLRRLVAFNHAIGSRLKLISRSREMRRGHATDSADPRILDRWQ